MGSTFDATEHDRAGLLRNYAPPPGRFDEMRREDGSLRPSWQSFLEHTAPIGTEELVRRWQRAQHLMHENGVSYNVYGDPAGLSRPWQLSPAPVLLESEEWASLSHKLAQRARLFDALLRDLYGPRRMLREGVLPPELVYDNPGFLRACHGMNVPEDLWLPLYAADVVRGPDGSFLVLDDRTQVPSGAGYALENRIVLSSVLPEAFRECNVERLAPFFRALRETLQRLAPHNRDNPRIVLLTPGPYNATYFEQAYLAQYLGYTLVNGGDLTVRDDRVYLKTLSGLSAIDVILRRVNDDYCDPLELRADSLLGVPGLCQAARMGQVAIASPLGSGALQTPALFAYLGELCRRLLGEPLALPSVPTYWCGEPGALREAESSWDDAIVKPTFGEGFIEPVATALLTREQRAALLTKVQAQPRRFVVQRRTAHSTTPVIEGGAVVPRALVLRCFGVAFRSDYTFMPGGLSRVASTVEGSEISMQLGARAKDTWVLSKEPVSNFTLLPASDQRAPISRGGADLPSRAADNLYWLGRYVERAEGVARLARVVSRRLNEISHQKDLESSQEFVALLRTLSMQTELLYAAPLPADRTLVLQEAFASLIDSVFDEKRAGSLTAVVKSTLRAGRLVRDRVSLDTFRVLAALEDELNVAHARVAHDPLGALEDVLNHVVVSLSAFSGLVMESMTRGQAFRFLDMGRRLERAMTVVTLLKGSLTRESAREPSVLEAVLEVADSSMTYRRRYLATLQTAPVVDLLLTDETNPRSVVYQLSALTEHLATLPMRTTSSLRSVEQRIALSALRDLELADPDVLCERGPKGGRERLAAFLESLTRRLPELSDALSDSYLNHATVSRHLGQEPQSAPAVEGATGGEP